MDFLKSLAIGAAGIATLLAGAYFASQGDDRQAPSLQHEAHSETAAPSPKAVLTPGQGNAIRIVIKPDSESAPGVYRFHKDDAANFLISVPYDGMLAIHGYTSDNPIVANQALSLALTLQHTGRFPMHVHSKDGQHIEVAVLEILPD